MAKPRVRYDELGRPSVCAVTIPAELAAYIYAAKREQAYKDETELVVAIVRAWAQGRPKPEWGELVKELMAEDEAQAAALKKKSSGGGKKTG